ncbi:Aerobic cobaltochelatase subunit CobN [Acaryochloris thomasi RCC1774]|uniref:Aerobic cobaltochelatase subunit CobN n=1 Tax=Acaryochloris thomasi RCC1774 TaxID=1764569 RepID=A0A2W1JNV9_9CYAN|nr:cobaltochelatase subunit CobN [Acaryochloris thomasi]PZD74979.1 Aerobic cobaltochelatase subunit CobN [Acaryochloris thomasi RCC1774]
MHRLAAMPGGWEAGAEGVIFIEQTPAPVVILTAADTDIQVLAKAITQLPDDAPELRVANLLQLQQQLTIDTYAEDVLSKAQVIVLRLLGGRSYWSYGLEVVQETVAKTEAALLVLPGDDRPDPDLMSQSTVPLAQVNQLWRYFTEGGIKNSIAALQFLSHSYLECEVEPPLPQSIARVARYPWQAVDHELSGEISEKDAVALHSPPRPPNSGGREPKVQFNPVDDLSVPSSSSAEAQRSLRFDETFEAQHKRLAETAPKPVRNAKVGILFYRAHYLAGNTDVIDALCSALSEQGLDSVPVFVQSLQAAENQAELLDILQADGIDLLINTTSFSLAKLSAETLNLQLWEQLNVPVLQAICSGGTEENWRAQLRGLSPRDMAMNVALPEVDGRIISRTISFKAVQARHAALETDVISYRPVCDRIHFVTQLAANWIKLRRTPAAERKIALILANYPNRDGRLANGVGLDTPASCIEILKAMAAEGYDLKDIPTDGDQLIERLTTGITNDPEAQDLRVRYQYLSLADYRQYFAELPEIVQQQIHDRWGSPDQYIEVDGFAIAGLQLGQTFIGIQPSRGYDLDPSLNYHAPDLEPTHAYLAFYFWLRHHFNAHAIIHVGKHGNLEWLPGKSVALSESCYPEVALGPMPHLYPFIVNDPGEGSQAKRRAQAVILDHLTPPLTRAELYGPLLQLEALIDEYYEAQSLDPSRVGVICDRIVTLIKQENLHQDLGIDAPNPKDKADQILDNFLSTADGYLCELKEAQIRDGLHIFGQCPEGEQLRDLIVALARHPSPGHVGITRAIAQDWNLDLDPLTADPAERLTDQQRACLQDGVDQSIAFCAGPPGPPILGGEQREIGVFPSQSGELETREDRDVVQGVAKISLIVGDAITILEQEATTLVEKLLGATTHITVDTQVLKTSKESISPNPLKESNTAIETLPPELGGRGGNAAPNETTQARHRQDKPPLPLPHPPSSITQSELIWIQNTLLPNLQKTPQEITNLLRGLDGQYVPSGASGAPTRGRPDVLPTGRNFYSVDIRSLPTESAWDVGRKAAETLIERYCQEQGDYPRTLGLSMWGTATMRTGGDDMAEALALLGVQPMWEGASRRVIDFEIIPLTILGRPRIDVTLRISGFFRDAFPNLIDLFDRAVNAVANLQEPADQNPLAAQAHKEASDWREQGLSEEEAELRSRFRIFGSKPGAYGAGLQGLIESQNWQDDEDLARAYINWSSYAYTAQPNEDLTQPNPSTDIAAEHSAPEAFRQRLGQLQIVLHNQDNREHDLLDSDDYYQFQGGLTAAVRSIQGQNPEVYFGDNAIPANPKVRKLEEELARVYRSRVINPKWIKGAMRHGYKGAFEMAATVDYLFAYDATTHCVADHMYRGVAEAYLLDPEVQDFIQRKNPWSLRDMSERLLEAHQRGLWDADETMVERLRSLVHQAEGEIEAKTL